MADENDMKKLIFAGVALAALFLGGPARSADGPMPVKAAPAPRAWDWTGFYAGIQGGGGSGTARETNSIFPFDSGSYNVSGGLGGITWGYNWQLDRWLVGFESDIAYASIKGSTAGGLPISCGGSPGSCSSPN